MILIGKVIDNSYIKNVTKQGNINLMKLTICFFVSISKNKNRNYHDISKIVFFVKLLFKSQLNKICKAFSNYKSNMLNRIITTSIYLINYIKDVSDIKEQIAQNAQTSRFLNLNKLFNQLSYLFYPKLLTVKQSF